MGKPKNRSWKQIALILKDRVAFAVTHLQAPHESQGGGFVVDMASGTSQSWRDYFADALETIPGVKVDRELMHARTYAQRRKILDVRARQAATGKSARRLRPTSRPTPFGDQK